MQTRQSGTRRPRRSGVVVPNRATWRQRVAAWLVVACLRTLAMTIRFRWHDGSGCLTARPIQPVIFAIWHNRLALSLVLYRKFVQTRQPERRMAAMVSASRDGAFMARILELFGVQPVRGSTSRRGPQALRELTSFAEQGLDLAITPDGPRGPCYSVQEGAIALAQVTGLPVVPASYRLNWKIRLPTWDQFQFPVPFARCDVDLDAALRVPRETSEEEREHLRRRLEERLRAINELPPLPPPGV